VKSDKKSKRKASRHARDNPADFADVLTAIGGRRGWISAALGSGVKRTKRPGAPRKDEERKLVLKRLAAGASWGKVMIGMNLETRQRKSKDAYRKLVMSCEWSKDAYRKILKSRKPQ